MKLPSVKADLDAVRRAVDAEAGCLSHSDAEPRRRIARNGAVSIWMQCPTCGLSVGSALKRDSFASEKLNAMPKWEDDLHDTFLRRYDALYEQRKEQAKKEAYEIWLRAYNEYLATDEWKQKTILVIHRAQGICEGCRSKKAAQVHHITYVHAGEEFLFELVALCRACHERFHFEIPMPPELMPTVGSKSRRSKRQRGADDSPF